MIQNREFLMLTFCDICTNKLSIQIQIQIQIFIYSGYIYVYICGFFTINIVCVCNSEQPIAEWLTIPYKA